MVLAIWEFVVLNSREYKQIEFKTWVKRDPDSKSAAEAVGSVQAKWAFEDWEPETRQWELCIEKKI